MGMHFEIETLWERVSEMHGLSPGSRNGPGDHFPSLRAEPKALGNWCSLNVNTWRFAVLGQVKDLQ